MSRMQATPSIGYGDSVYYNLPEGGGEPIIGVSGITIDTECVTTITGEVVLLRTTLNTETGEYGIDEEMDEETCAILGDRATMNMIEEAEDDIRARRTISGDELRSRLQE